MAQTSLSTYINSPLSLVVFAQAVDAAVNAGMCFAGCVCCASAEADERAGDGRDDGRMPATTGNVLKFRST